MSSLRFLQLKVTPEQAELLPSNQIMSIFEKFETVSTISTKGKFPELLFSVTFENPNAIETFDQLDAFEITEILEHNEKAALISAYTKGPIPMLVHSNPETWIHTPSTVSKISGLFLTVLGTSKGLKRFRDEILQLLPPSIKISISENANLSINETLARTIITSITTLLALFSIFIFGGEILRGFSFAMILGVLIGTYSSIFVASPILKFFKVSYKTLEKEEEKIVP